MIEKTRIKDNTYEWGSVWWETKARVEESTWLTYTGLHDKTNQKYLKNKDEVARNPRMWWTIVWSRGDDRPTDTKADTEPLVRTPPTIVSRREEDAALRKWRWGSDHCHGTVAWDAFLKLKQKSQEPIIPRFYILFHFAVSFSFSLFFPTWKNCHFSTHFSLQKEISSQYLIGPHKAKTCKHIFLWKP